MLQLLYNSNDAVTPLAGAFTDIVAVMDRHGLNLSAARVLQIIDRLVYASRLRGVKDKRGIPYCYASKEWIAEHIGKSVRTVARAIRDLKAAGLVECKRTRANAMLFITGYEAAEAPAAKPASRTKATGTKAVTEEPTNGTKAATEEPTNGTKAAAAAEASVECAPSPAAGRAVRVTSKVDTYVTSKINTQSINTSYGSLSIHRSDTPREGMDRRDNSARFARERDGERALIEAERRTLRGELVGQMIHTGARSEDTSGACMAAADYIAEAVASGRDIRVNGVNIGAKQYWDVVKDVDGGRLEDTLRGIAARDCLGIIRNKRAYLLSSVYNCALWGRFATVQTDFREVVRIAEGLPGRRSVV